MFSSDLLRNTFRKMKERSLKMNKLFSIVVVVIMGISSVALAGGCGGSADHDHDAKKKMKKYDKDA